MFRILDKQKHHRQGVATRTSRISFVLVKTTGPISEVLLFSDARCCLMDASYAFAAECVDGLTTAKPVKISCTFSMVI